MTRYFYLKALRLKRQMTQVKLAKKSGVPQNVISRYERNRDANPPLGTVIDLARALGVDPLRLRFGPAPKPGGSARPINEPRAVGGAP